MYRKMCWWEDNKGDFGSMEPDGDEFRLTLKEGDGNEAIHYLTPETVSQVAFHAMRLASPECPKAGEFWIVEVDGKRRVVQVQDSPTADTLREDVRFIARIPVEAQ